MSQRDLLSDGGVLADCLRIVKRVGESDAVILRARRSAAGIRVVQGDATASCLKEACNAGSGILLQ